MTQEDKLLFIELCARLPYGVKVKCGSEILTFNANWLQMFQYHLDEIKPYLRPISSMTEEEFEDLKSYSGLKYEQLDLALFQNGTYKCLDFYLSEVPSDVVILVFDWLNKNHLDYRGLIPMGIALEAPKEMYKTE